MPVICKNCGSLIEQNFCTVCGQKKEVQRITWPFILKEILHFFTHVEKGFILSSLKMFYKPGAFAKSYLEGQRKGKQAPVSFLFIWAGIFLLIRQALISLFDYKQEILNTPSFIDEKAALYYFTHVTYITIIFIPFYAAIIWVVSGLYRKLNYSETITICFYAYGIFFFILSLITLVGGLIFQMNILSAEFNNIYTVSTGLNALWQWYSLIKQFEPKYPIIRSFAVMITGGFIMIKFIELISLVVL